MTDSEAPYSAEHVWRVALAARFEQRITTLRKFAGVIQFLAGETQFHFILGGAATAMRDGVHPAPDTRVDVDREALRKLMFDEGEPGAVFEVAGNDALYEQVFEVLAQEEERGRSWLDVRARS